MLIKNNNFISEVMNLTDIKHAFNYNTAKPVKEFIYGTLIEQGYISKRSERQYSPTQKLIDLAFIPDMLVLTSDQRRRLQTNRVFYFVELADCVGGKWIAKKLISLGHFMLGTDKRYRKSSNLEDALMDGEDVFKLK